MPGSPSHSSSSFTKLGLFTAFLGLLMYGLAVVSYTTAVFTDPGSPLDPPRASHRSGRGGAAYSSLPTHEPRDHAELGFVSLTAKSSGKPRYCKKCAVTKPDRAHHCSTCNRCVLKMDHHCPWLATCVGMRNYKPFLLFLIYISLFCWVCFPVSGLWVWREIIDQSVQVDEGVMLVNVIMLSVLSGIIGLVLTGFTAWHCYLATKGQTTIESLEKTRYLSPLKKSMERQFKKHRTGDGDRNYLADEQGLMTDNDHDGQETVGEQLREIHANMLPGVTRPEEGVDTPYDASTPTSQNISPAQSALRKNYAELEADHERDRYSAYLDELDSEKLPHAFNLGWRQNLRLLFGDTWYLWPLPVCNTLGDGWQWEVSEEWIRRRDEIAFERRRRDEEEAARSRAAGWGGQPDAAPWQQGRPDQDYWNNDYNPPSGAGRHYTNQQYSNQHQVHHTPWTPTWAQNPDSPDPETLEFPPSATDAEAASRDEEYDRGRYLTTTAGVAAVPRFGRRSPNKADLLLGRPSGVFNPSTFHSSTSRNGSISASRSRERIRQLVGVEGTAAAKSAPEVDEYDTSSDEADSARKTGGKGREQRGQADWNDIPEEMFSGAGKRGTSPRRTKGD